MQSNHIDISVEPNDIFICIDEERYHIDFEDGDSFENLKKAFEHATSDTVKVNLEFPY